MNTKRGQRMAPPAGADQWEVRCARSHAGKGRLLFHVLSKSVSMCAILYV